MTAPDAPQIDVNAFYARRPHRGQLFHRLGLYAMPGVLYAWLWGASGLWLSFVLLLALWLLAWYQEVGALWRGRLVCGLALTMCLLVLERLNEQGAVA